jgi:phosphoadenosine phosphosulfate reductase
MRAPAVRLFSNRVAAIRLAKRFSRVSAISLLRLALEDLFPGRIALVSSFGADSVVLLHMVSEIDSSVPVVFIDSGRHFPETLAYRDEICAHLKLSNVIVASPDPAALGAEDAEERLFASDPDRCCHIRKTLPLAKVLERFEAWITGRKAHQTLQRTELSMFESEGNRVKLNPLASWSAADVLYYIDRAGLPRHPLIDKGYASIGCQPCTSAVSPGEDLRAGRWRGCEKTECGIHLRIPVGSEA